MRNSFANEITQLSRLDDDLILLSGDIGNKLFDPLKEIAPEKVLNCGIAEQSMIGVGAGMANLGLKPIVYTITPFTTYRCFEQIRVDVCYNNLKVIIVGTGSGLSYATLGPTHQSLEDIAILRSLPSMTVFCPCDPNEVRFGLRAALDHDGPVYIRLGKKGEPVLYENPDEQITLGKAVTLRQGDDICIIGTGPILGEALKAADELSARGLGCHVENFHSIKPIDTQRLDELAAKFEAVIVIEEHSKIGGLFSAIAEYYADKTLRPSLHSLGTGDLFLHEIGSQQFARQHFGITAESIIQKAAQLGH